MNYYEVASCIGRARSTVHGWILRHTGVSYKRHQDLPSSVVNYVIDLAAKDEDFRRMRGTPKVRADTNACHTSTNEMAMVALSVISEGLSTGKYDMLALVGLAIDAAINHQKATSQGKRHA